jgi:intracellular sulfur oxidation DsrE/DsrF family protein
MNNRTKGIKESAPRRNFFSHLGGMMVLGAAALVPKSLHAEAAAEKPDSASWPGSLNSHHKQLVDAYDINGGYPLGFVHNFLQPNESVNESATGVIILRHNAFSLALNHAMWEKYKIGETFKINDPETKAPAKKNPYFQVKPGVLNNDEIAIDRLLARGVIFGACNVALRGQARRLSGNAGVTAEEAAKEFTANIIPGVTVIPSGVWGVNRAQEAGCTYCAGG